MPTPFARIEERTTRAVFAHLANVEVVIGGVAVACIFDADYDTGVLSEYGVDGVAPVLTLPTARVPVPHFGVVLAIRGTDYKIVSHKPDGTGLSRLVLSAYQP